MEERTFVAIKPDGVQRGLIGKIIERFENKGYKIVGLKMIHPDLDLAKKHYIIHKDKSFFGRLVKYFTSGPIVAMVIQGCDCIMGVRQMIGSTNPNEASPGTIRCDFSQRKENNVIHSSDSLESAKYEINLYFNPEELCNSWNTMSEIIFKNEK